MRRARQRKLYAQAREKDRGSGRRSGGGGKEVGDAYHRGGAGVALWKQTREHPPTNTHFEGVADAGAGPHPLRSMYTHILGTSISAVLFCFLLSLSASRLCVHRLHKTAVINKGEWRHTRSAGSERLPISAPVPPPSPSGRQVSPASTAMTRFTVNPNLNPRPHRAGSTAVLSPSASVAVSRSVRARFVACTSAAVASGTIRRS